MEVARSQLIPARNSLVEIGCELVFAIAQWDGIRGLAYREITILGWQNRLRSRNRVGAIRKLEIQQSESDRIYVGPIGSDTRSAKKSGLSCKQLTQRRA